VTNQELEDFSVWSRFCCTAAAV